MVDYPSRYRQDCRKRDEVPPQQPQTSATTSLAHRAPTPPVTVPPKNRPSMISAKYRQKEERRKVLKISINKLKKIEDPEASLCRSVLINNTMKRLQKEARDEKIQKQQLNYPRCYDNDNYLNLKSEFIKNETKNVTNFDEPQAFHADEKLHIDIDFDTKLAEEISGVAKDMEDLGNLVDENLSNLTVAYQGETVSSATAENDRFASRKRSFDDVDDCDVQDVLSQFYMPPTPRMLTCIDDDEDVNVVDDEPLPKKAKIEQQTEEASGSCRFASDVDKSICDKAATDYSVNNYLNNNVSVPESRLRYLNANQSMESDTNSYSCGHASMFSEFQSNVYHLVTSLET
ncbi:hypothetical protein NQ318_005939 [Aromia moschata]|uniref:SERTA domain-containing protein n=1 Tax=Aromia moschata TaxID=1265417 RepID=A0AAV8YFA9_9CUCU|nr:hypothetical protein NQ318_005939 [Aromia moschata]